MVKSSFLALQKRMWKDKPVNKLQRELEKFYFDQKNLDKLTKNDKAELTLIRREFEHKSDEQQNKYKDESQKIVEQMDKLAEAHGNDQDDLAFEYINKELDRAHEMVGGERATPVQGLFFRTRVWFAQKKHALGYYFFKLTKGRRMKKNGKAAN